jgi:hypothetical protein
MTVVENADLLQPSNCHVRDGMVIAYGQGGQHLDAGLLVLSRHAFAQLPTCGALADALVELARQGEIRANVVHHRPHHVGDPQALAELESSLVLR